MVQWKMDENPRLHPLKLTASLYVKDGWLEDEFPFGAQQIFRGELLVSGKVASV